MIKTRPRRHEKAAYSPKEQETQAGKITLRKSEDQKDVSNTQKATTDSQDTQRHHHPKPTVHMPAGHRVHVSIGTHQTVADLRRSIASSIPA